MAQSPFQEFLCRADQAVADLRDYHGRALRFRSEMMEMVAISREAILQSRALIAEIDGSGVWRWSSSAIARRLASAPRSEAASEQLRGAVVDDSPGKSGSDAAPEALRRAATARSHYFADGQPMIAHPDRSGAVSSGSKPDADPDDDPQVARSNCASPYDQFHQIPASGGQEL